MTDRDREMAENQQQPERKENLVGNEQSTWGSSMLTNWRWWVTLPVILPVVLYDIATGRKVMGEGRISRLERWRDQRNEGGKP